VAVLGLRSRSDRRMDAKTYIITADGKGGFEVQISHGIGLGTTFQHDFKIQDDTLAWVRARKGENDRVIS
jgi:hypothetical protein